MKWCEAMMRREAVWLVDVIAALLGLVRSL